MKKLDDFKKNSVEASQDSEIFKKKEANLQSNSSLYFQIGLILCLLASYGLFEMKFKIDLPAIVLDPIEDSETFTLSEIIIEPDAPKPEPKINKPVAMVITKMPIVKPNTFIGEVPKLETPESKVPTIVPVSPNPPKIKIEEPNIPLNNGIVDLNKVEVVPIFPGCESASTNQERLKCMSDKLAKLIQKKFNTDLAADLNLHGIQRIQVQFKIDDKGLVTDIKTRSPYIQLEKEAERVVSKIPVMKPGMQQNTPVSVLYNMPIAFQVH